MLSSFSTTSSYTQALDQGKGIYETSNSKTVPPMEGGSERINCNLIRASTLPALEHITSCSISSLAAGRVPAALAGARLVSRMGEETLGRCVPISQKGKQSTKGHGLPWKHGCSEGHRSLVGSPSDTPQEQIKLFEVLSGRK